MKKYSVLLILIICSQFVNAQTFQWQGAIGGNYIDIPNSIWVGSDGCTYITGNYSSKKLNFGSQVIANNLNSSPANFFIIKIDITGNVVFARDANITADAYGVDIRTDSSQNIYSLILNNNPYFLKIENDTFLSGQSGACVLLVKYNSNGDFLWGKPFSNNQTYNTLGAGIDIIDDNNIISCSSDIVYLSNSTGNVTSTTFNLKICDFDSTGNIKWTKSLINIPELLKVQTDRNGNINLLCKKYIDSVIVDSQYIACDSLDFFLIRFNKNGDFLEYIPFLSYDNFENISFTIDNKDNIYFTGSFSSNTFSAFNLPTQYKINQNSYSKDIFIVKTNYHGSGKWINSAQSYSQKELYKLAADSLGNIYGLGCQYQDTGLYYNNVFYPASPGNFNFLIKLDTSGNLLDYIPATNYSSLFYSFRVSAPNEIYITSQIPSGSNGLFGSTTFNSYGASDIWFGKFTYNTGVNQKEQSDLNISIYPNPSSDFVNFMIDRNIKFQKILITDLFGKIVKPSSKINISSNRINISELAKGMYFINVSTDKGSKTFKFIKI